MSPAGRGRKLKKSGKDDMPPDRQEQDDLDALGERIRRSKDRHRRAGAGRARHASPLGVAFRIMTELVVAVMAAVLAGWGLDSYFGTWPWMLLLLTPLGMAAGVLNVLRAAKALDDADFGAVPPASGEKNATAGQDDENGR